MSLTKALDHAWLLSYTPVYPSSRRPEKQTFGNAQNVTHAGVTEDFVALQFQESALEVSNPGSSRTAPLQRRSLVLSEAAESGSHLPEPPWEMIAYAASQEQEKATSESSSSAKGANKRIHAELSPLPEEFLDDAGMSASGSGDDPSGKEKLASSSAPDEESSNDRPRRSTRRNKVARRD